jgi:hypothetical protein
MSEPDYVAAPTDHDLTNTGWTRAGLKQPPFPRGGWCPTCGDGFTSDSGFATHRVGGRCRTPEEMRRKGYQVNDNGLWKCPDTSGRAWGRGETDQEAEKVAETAPREGSNGQPGADA